MNEVVHAIGKKTIAEFVEDQETLAILSAMNIDYCQGYYVGQPAPFQNKKNKVIYLH